MRFLLTAGAVALTAAASFPGTSADAALVSAVISGANADHTVSGILRWDTEADGFAYSPDGAPQTNMWISTAWLTIVKDGLAPQELGGNFRYTTTPGYNDYLDFFAGGSRIQTLISFKFPPATYTGGKLPSSLPMTVGEYSYSDAGRSYSLPLTFLMSAVPEPASWALMIGGIGLAGGMMRRQRASRVTYA